MIASSSDGMLLIGLALGLALYFLPTIIAVRRKSREIGLVLVLNVLLGWTLVAWIVALAVAATSRTRLT